MLMSDWEKSESVVNERIIIDRPVAEFSDCACDSRDIKWHPLIDSDARDLNGRNRNNEIAGGYSVADMPIKKGDKEYMYSIVNPRRTVLPVSNYRAYFMVAPVDSKSSVVEWRASFDSLSPDARDTISSMFAVGLSFLKQELEA